MDVITGVAYTPVSSALNFHSADGSQRTANRLVLHPTPEGRTFPWTIFQLYDANLYCTAFHGSTCFPNIWTRNISSGRCDQSVVEIYHGKSSVPLSGQRCSEISFHSASASTSLGATLVTDYVNFEHKCRFTAWFARVASHSNPADQPSR